MARRVSVPVVVVVVIAVCLGCGCIAVGIGGYWVGSSSGQSGLMRDRPASPTKDRAGVGFPSPTHAPLATPPPPPPSPTATLAPRATSTTTPTATPTSLASISPRTAKIDRAAQSYKVSAEYPSLSGSPVSLAIEAFVRQEVDDFVRQAERDWPLEPAGKSAPPYTLEIRYESYQFSPAVHSFRFDLVYYTGGAHPNSAIVTKTYDLDTNRELGLTDIFLPETPYLMSLADMSVDQLTRGLPEADEAWILQVAGPHAENFSRFVLTEREIILYFDPYQATQNARGPQEVRLSLKQLASQGVLRPRFAS